MIRDHAGNEYETQKEMCEHYGIKLTTYVSRIRNGWSQDRALMERTVNHRTNKSLKQYCEENGLEEILLQFDDEKNYPYTVENISPMTNKILFFTYPCGCTVSQRVADKTSHRSISCPKCQNRGAIGRSITDEYPDSYALMFDEKKNGIKASEVPFRSGKEYWWNCLTCGHAFLGKTCYVTSGKRVCQECNNKKQSDPEKILAYYLSHIDPDRIINYKIEGWSALVNKK